MESYPRQATLKRRAHSNYFLRCLAALPTAAQGHDSNRITIAYFCISALDLLGVLEQDTSAEQRLGWTDWIWSLQAPAGGFMGSTYMVTPNPSTSPAHLPSTYTALLCLAILRAPLDRLNIPGLVLFLTSCQAESGSFSPLAGDEFCPLEGFQSDARMAYIACVISDIIRDFSSINTQTLQQWIESCRTWEGGYASRPGVVEAQGGTTYCSLVALSLLSQNTFLPSSSTVSPQRDRDTMRWLVARQIGGFQGRPGKLEDVCYSFWCGAALKVLGHAEFINHQADKTFLLSAQSPFGGFGKEPEDYPDPFHSYLALAALSVSHSSGAGQQSSDGLQSLGLKELDVRWNVSVDTAEWLREEINRVKAL